MRQLFDRMTLFFEGSIEPDKGIEINGIVYRTTDANDIDDLVALEPFWPGGLALPPNDVEKDLELFPDLQVIATDIKTGAAVGKATMVRIDPEQDDMEQLVESEEGWYGLYQRRAKQGRLHEGTGVVVDRKYQGLRQPNIGLNACLVLCRALVESTLKGDHFERLTWSSSNHLFPRYVRRQLKLPNDSSLEDILKAYQALSKKEGLELHRSYVDKIIAGKGGDIPLSLHANLALQSGGLIKMTNPNVYCPEDKMSLGMGTRFDGTDVITSLVSWQKSLRARGHKSE